MGRWRWGKKEKAEEKVMMTILMVIKKIEFLVLEKWKKCLLKKRKSLINQRVVLETNQHFFQVKPMKFVLFQPIPLAFLLLFLCLRCCSFSPSLCLSSARVTERAHFSDLSCSPSSA